MKALGRFEYRRPLYRRVPTAGGVGHTTEHYGDEIVTFSVEFDPDGIASSVAHCVQNKSGVAKMLHGAVIGRVVSRTPAEKSENSFAKLKAVAS